MKNNICTLKIREVIEHTRALLSAKAFNKYSVHFKRIMQYCVDNDLVAFSYEDAWRFSDIVSKEAKPYQFKEFRKVAYTVAGYFESGEFQWRRISKLRLPDSREFKEAFLKFEKKSLETLASGTVRLETTIIRQFLFFLEANGVFCFSSMSIQHVKNFIQENSPNHKGSMGTFLRSIKKFIRFLHGENLTAIKAEKLLVTPAPTRVKVLPCFSGEELDRIFSVIDKNTEKGARDYAVFLMALRTGLRASDIVKLQLSDIDWHKNMIRVTQQKTCRMLELPLMPDVGNALARYILQYRPKADTPYIFLRLHELNHWKPLHPSSFNGYLRQYMSKSGITCVGWDGKTFHALRRTAGTNLIKSGSPAAIVAQILGHRDMESSKRYLSLNTETLRECCMDLGYLHTRKELLL